MPQFRVLLFIDQSKRDLLGMRMLEIALQKKGVKTMRCSHANWRPAFRRFKPHAFVSSRGDHRGAQTAAKCCYVYVVPGEGNALTKETVLTIFMGRSFFSVKDTGWIKRSYPWNQGTHDLLLEHQFRQDQVKVVGNMRLDIYRYPAYIKPKGLKRKGDFTLGVAFSAKSTSTYSGPNHFALSYFKLHPDLNFPMVQKGRHHEDMVWRDCGILRRMMRYIKRYLDTMPGKVLLRPSPLEDPREYKFLEKLYPGRIQVLPRQEFADWVSSVDAVLTCWSTAGVECLLYGVPVISIWGTFDKEHLFNHINPQASGFDSYIRYYHAPQSEDELFDVLAQAQRYELPLSPMPQAAVAQMLKEIYNWPYPVDASETIADDIFKDLSAGVLNTSDEQWRMCFPMKHNIPPFINYWLNNVRALWGHYRSGAFASEYDYFRTVNPRVERILKKLGVK
ncbi:MAG: hypothetical protein HQM16_16175 [Deltaproteobacteria bacterium]|nr:hypothetical protein [Deltaproteobacteria bacterium]